MPKKSIETLEEDIKSMLAGVISGKSVLRNDLDYEILGNRIATKVKQALTARTKVRPPKTLYMSEIGQPCKRKLWYEYRTSTGTGTYTKENLLPQNLIKFLYGDILEEILLFLAESAEHEVRDRQQKVEVEVGEGWKLIGKLDAIIDDTVVDCKSASSYSFRKFERGLTEETDDFGYIPQLKGYHGAIKIREANSKEFNKETGNPVAFLIVDKTTGDITTDTHDAKYSASDTFTIGKSAVKAITSIAPPDRGFSLELTTGGNLGLGINCSYCPFKYECWSDANDGHGLRTFIYKTGPVFLAKINEGALPRVTEITDLIKERQQRKDVPSGD